MEHIKNPQALSTLDNTKVLVKRLSLIDFPFIIVCFLSVDYFNVGKKGQFHLQSQKASKLTKVTESVCLSTSSAPLQVYGQRCTYTCTYSHTHVTIS